MCRPLSAFMPSTSVTYSATKAYLVKFSQALQNELLIQGCGCRRSARASTYSEFHDTPEYSRFNRAKVPGFLWLTAEEVVSESLRDLERGKVICVPGRIYRLIKALSTGWLTGAVLRVILRRVIQQRNDM